VKKSKNIAILLAVTRFCLTLTACCALLLCFCLAACAESELHDYVSDPVVAATMMVYSIRYGNIVGQGPQKIVRKEVVGERCCSPDNSLKEPAVNHKGNDDFTRAQILGKTYPFPH
jgi:hypothetical protein